MAAGQMLDLLAVEAGTDIDAIARLQRLKTGALISWAVEAGATLGGASPEQKTSLRGYAQKLGLAFQIADDLLDHDGDAATVGKRVRKDEAQGKATFVSVLGPERSRRQAQILVDQAEDHLRCFEGQGDCLSAIAEFAIARLH
jgi:farnesyl diphosphate synthase